MTPRPVGFDLDLTLIDSRPQILESFRALANESGVSIGIDEVSARLGLKLEDELAYWFEPHRIDAAATIYRRHYVAMAAATVALPGAREALEAVRRRGAPSAIITAKHEVSVGPCLVAAGLSADSVWPFVHGEEKSAVLRRLDAAAYVGDTPADMAAARSAGAFGVGVTTGSFAGPELRAAGADVVLDTLERFAAWYEAWSTQD